MQALQKLAERLTQEAPSVLARMPLTPELLAALEEAKRIKSLNALRRHYRRLGKLLRNEEMAAIQQVIDEIDRGHQAGVARFHALERWRDRLLEGDSETFGAFLQQYPHTDRQHLRQLIRQAKKERAENKPPRASRVLFRYIRDLD